jgi:hypothetical protein
MLSSPLSGGYPPCQPSGLSAANTGRASGNDGIVRVLVPLTEARKASRRREVSSTGQPRSPDPDIREVIREVIREALAVSAPDDREDIRTLQRVLEERERTIAAHEETIRHLRGLLADERRRLIAILTDDRRRPWWRRWFR